MSEQELERYLKFMYNKENILNCDECPENENRYSEIERMYPCGQQNCWVTCHCK